jgi:hypothetical protein
LGLRVEKVQSVKFKVVSYHDSHYNMPTPTKSPLIAKFLCLYFLYNIIYRVHLLSMRAVEILQR